MIPRLILRHEIIHTLTKPLLITVTTVTLMLNVMAFQMARTESAILVEGSRVALAQYAFLIPFIVTMWMGRADNRCRPWEAGLPLGSRSLWWAYLGALILATVGLITVAGIAFLGFGSLISLTAGKTIFSAHELVELIARPAAVSICAACLVAAWSPRSGRPANARGWSRFRLIVILGAVGLLGILTRVPAEYSWVPVIAGGLWAWRSAASLGPVLDMDGDNPSGGLGTSAKAAWPEVGPSSRVVRLMILRTLFKWPLSWLAIGPIAALFGLIMGGVDFMGMDEPYLRFTSFFMVVYLLFAMSNHFMENLYKVDHLPISRRALLRWMVVPVTLFFLAGYGAGRVVEVNSADRSEAIVFDNEEERFGLKVPPEVWDLSFSNEQHPISAPWGETHTAKDVPVIKGLPAVLWKPYSTPTEASREFIAWQISRAAAEVYGLDVPPAEIAARYLIADGPGRVKVRAEGLTLRADFPMADPGMSGPLMPVWVGAELVFLMVVNALFFRVFRPGITIRKSRIVFWFIMGGLMALHILGFVFFSTGWTREWIVYGFWMGRIRELGSLGPVGYGAAWLGAVVLLGLSWHWAEKTFEKAEAPST